MSAQQALDKAMRAAVRVRAMLEPGDGVGRVAMAEFVLASSALSDAIIELDQRIKKGEQLPGSWAVARAERAAPVVAGA